MKLIYMLTLTLSTLIYTGCSDDSSTTTAPTVPDCTTLQTTMDSALVAYAAGAMSADAATLCQTALTAVTALKDNSCNASTMMLDADGVTWPVDAEDVAEIQASCDAISGG